MNLSRLLPGFLLCISLQASCDSALSASQQRDAADDVFVCYELPCEELAAPYPKFLSLTGIAGAVAYRHDYGTRNNCTECSFTHATFFVWHTEEWVDSADAAREVVLKGPPTYTIEVEDHFEYALDTGWYLVCGGYPYVMGPGCARFEVQAGKVTTLNVKPTQVAGASIFTVFDPGSQAPNVESDLNIGFVDVPKDYFE